MTARGSLFDFFAGDGSCPVNFRFLSVLTTVSFITGFEDNIAVGGAVDVDVCDRADELGAAALSQPFNEVALRA